MTAQPVHDNPEQKYEVTPLELFFDLDPRHTCPVVIPDMGALPADQVSWANAWLRHR